VVDRDRLDVGRVDLVDLHQVVVLRVVNPDRARADLELGDQVALIRDRDPRLGRLRGLVELCDRAACAEADVDDVVVRGDRGHVAGDVEVLAAGLERAAGFLVAAATCGERQNEGQRQSQDRFSCHGHEHVGGRG
jgi:hypothetical protein